MIRRCFLLPSIFLLAVASDVGPVLATDKPLEGPLAPFIGAPKLEMRQVFRSERFPNVVVTVKGTVLATWGNKSVRARRSEDGGRTWGDEIVIAKPGFQGGGTTVDEQTGERAGLRRRSAPAGAADCLSQQG